MIIELSIEEAKKSWDSLLLKMTNYNFYQSYSNGMIEGVKNRRPRFLIYYVNNKIVAMAMCLYQSKITTIPFGPIFDECITQKQFMEILEDIQNYVSSKIVFSVEEKDFEKFSYAIDNYVTYWDFTTIVLDTSSKSLEQIIMGFNTNRKRILKRCLLELKDFIIETDIQNIDKFFDLYVKRLNETKCKIDFDESYIKGIVNQSNTGLVVCKNTSNEIISGLIYYTFGHTLITRHNAFDSKFAKLNPGTFLDFYMIKNVVNDEQYQYYDMSGLAVGENIETKLLNINRYKESYGAKKKVHYKWLEYGGR